MRKLGRVQANRRQIFLAGAALTASTVAATRPAEAATPGKYGSGQLGAWQQMPHAVSTEAQIKRVVETDGVYMFGDSMGVQDGKALAIRLGQRSGDQLAVHNWSSRPTKPAVDAFAQWAARYGMPRRILMATGTNDIFSPPEFAAQVARAMSIAGSRRTVYWVNVQVSRTRYSAAVQIADQRNSGWINAQLADAQRQYPNLRIVRWAEYLAVKPSRITNYLRDGIHTSVPAGQNARNELIVRELVKPLT